MIQKQRREQFLQELEQVYNRYHLYVAGSNLYLADAKDTAERINKIIPTTEEQVIQDVINEVRNY